jgi:PAS domain S-box-containing protein
MRRRWLVLAWLVAAVESAAAVAIAVVGEPDGLDTATLTLALAVALSFITSGLVALWRRPRNRTGYLLAAVGYLWFFGALTETGVDWLFTLGVALGSSAFGAFAHLLLAFPTGRLHTLRDRALVLATYGLVLGASVAILLVDETPSAGCADCRSTIALADSDDAREAIHAAFTVLASLLAAAIVTIIVRRHLTASRALRRVLGPVLASGALALVLVCAELIVAAVSEDAAQPLEYVVLGTFATVPLAFLAGVLRSRLARAGVGDLLLALGRGTPIRDAIAEALGDPTLEIAYWQPDEGAYLGADGAPLPENGTPRHVSLVEHAGRPTAALVHDPLLAEEQELVEAVAAAAALWLDNERLQAKLRAQYEFLETIVDAAPSLLVALDREGRIANLNGAARRASGVADQEDVRWRPFWDVFVAPTEREEARSRFEAAAPDHFATAFEHTFANAVGEELTIAWSTAPLLDETGAVTGIVYGGLDITERRRREQELEVERDFAGTVANTIPVFLVGVWDDATVNGYGPNPAFEHNLGWTREDTTGRSLLDFVHPEDRYLAGMAIASAANGVPSERRESRWLHKNGSTRIVSWSAREILGLDGRTVVLVSGADVSERYAQAEELRASRARIVKAGDAERRRLERNLHDGAQQRLVALSLSLRLAQAKLQDDPQGAEQVLEASRAELAAALDELRELARGIHPAVLTDRGLAAALEMLAQRAPIPVVIETPPERLPPEAEAAAYYVIAEALANVAKYAKATEVTVRVTREDDCARVRVEDDGVGGADPALGTGLRGLADRVAALEGTIAIDSPRGGGTRIEVELPLEADPDEWAAKASA